MKCKHCKTTIKECRCGLGHGYIHTAAPVEEQLHRCWPNAGHSGHLPGNLPQGRKSTFAQPGVEESRPNG